MMSVRLSYTLKSLVGVEMVRFEKSDKNSTFGHMIEDICDLVWANWDVPLR